MNGTKDARLAAGTAAVTSRVPGSSTERTSDPEEPNVAPSCLLSMTDTFTTTPRHPPCRRSGGASLALAVVMPRRLHHGTAVLHQRRMKR